MSCVELSEFVEMCELHELCELYEFVCVLCVGLNCISCVDNMSQILTNISWVSQREDIKYYFADFVRKGSTH